MKIHIAKIALLLCCIVFAAGKLSAQTITIVEQNNHASIRGLSVVGDKVAWLSGSGGNVAITLDGGQTWAWQQVKGFEKADFRDIEAFSDKEAVIMSSGTPALVLKTTDGGSNWKVNYRNADTAYFLDAMDFDSPKHGIILGDPIQNKFLLLETTDGGDTWMPFKDQPDALPGEAAFAASGTCLRFEDHVISFASGGSSARLITYSLKDGAWHSADLPLVHGQSSQGAFSVAMGKKERVIIGGDYVHDKKADSVVCILTKPYDDQFGFAAKGPAGFQSCVEFIGGSAYLATGTPGSNITMDGGKTWAKISETSFNVCRKAKHGKLVLLAGSAGKSGILKL